MAELKLTGIRVVEEGAGQVKAELLSVGDAGDKVEASFRATARAATESAQQMNVSARAAQQMGVSLDQLAAAANGDAAAMRALAAATNQVTVAATQASGAFTRMSAPGVSGFRQLEQEVVSIVRMSAPAVSGFRQLADAQETVKVSSGRLNEEIGHTSGLSHSAVIGIGELARGVGRVAEAGNSARSRCASSQALPCGLAVRWVRWVVSLALSCYSVASSWRRSRRRDTRWRRRARSSRKKSPRWRTPRRRPT
jgi:hypothetical protein